MVTISACVLARNEENEFFRACIRKLLEFCDEIIVIIDSRTTDNTESLLQSFGDKRIKTFTFDWTAPESYTSARNYAITKATKDYCLHIDGDEILDDNADLKKEIERQLDIDCFDLASEHYLWHLGFRDATFNPHIHLQRLHKNKPGIKYPENKMHGLVGGWKTKTILCNRIIIHHYGYCKNMLQIIERYKQNKERLEMHTPNYLTRWKNSHLFGTMPAQAVNPLQHPKEIKELFEL